MKFISKLSNVSLVCNELQVKDYKEIIKCTIGDEPDIDIFIETFCSIMSNVTNKPLDFIKSLSIIDLLYLLIDIRYNSLGVCKLIVKNGDKKIGLELNLETVKQDLLPLFKVLTDKASFKEIEVTLSVPSIVRLNEPFEEDYIPYITSCTFDGNKTFDVTTNTQAIKMFNLFPPKLSLQIISKFNKLIQQICSIDLLKRYNIPNQHLMLIPTVEFLIWFTKLLFGEDLGSFYENVFSLSYSGKMNAEYIENLPVGEYNYFIGLLKQTLSTKDSTPGELHNDLSHLVDGLP